MFQMSSWVAVHAILLLTATTRTSAISTAIGNHVSEGKISGKQTINNPSKKLLHIVRRGLMPNKFSEIIANVTLYDSKILQLQVNWKDNLPKDTSFNVIVSALNITQCPDPPCSLYGTHKSAKSLLIPENPMSYVNEMECNYMFGCNYSIMVETSNTRVKQTSNISIPYCVQDICSCQHVKYPKLVTAARVSNNQTIIFNWAFKLNEILRQRGTEETSAILKLLVIYLKISKQSNPSLPWGGKLLPIHQQAYALHNLTYSRTKDHVQGDISISLRQQLAVNSVLNLHSYIVDETECPGPDTLITAKVPPNKEWTALVEEDHRLRTALIIVTAFFFSAITTMLFYCLWKRRKQRKTQLQLHRDTLYMTPFAPVIEMEDNLNYVDKYVEEAQAKGLADMFELPHHSIRFEEEIGEGAFGRVYKGTAINLRRMRGLTVVAIKQLKKNPSADEVGEFLSEIEMLKGVGTHHNVVCFLGCCTIRPPYLMIMEFVGRGDLLSYLRTVRQESSKFKGYNANYANGKAGVPKPLPTVKYIELKISSEQSIDSEAEFETRQPKPSFAETTYTIIDDEEFKKPFEYKLDNKELHNFALQIANGMRFLEEQEITHRDLAARNVLIDDKKTLKISDFGLSRHGIYTNTKTRKLPLRWLSIEAIRDNIYSSKSDVWAYGVVLWEIGTLGASPYPAISNHELIPYLKAGKRLEKPEICTEQVYAIMLQCWDEEPEARPTFNELYEALSPKTAYVDINSLSDDYVFPPIQQDKDNQ